MNDSMAETVSNLPAVRPHTQPIPVITDDTPPPVHYTYAPLYQEALDREWHETQDGEAWRLGPHNQQVYRALEAIAEGVLRERDPGETTDRAKLLLVFDPSGDGTPMRCEKCATVYTVGEGIPDWQLAGRRSGVCWDCTTAPKTIVVTPSQVRNSRRRRAPKAAS